MRLLEEIKRRRVTRVAVGYIVIAWLLVQVAETTFEPLLLPEWTVRLVVILAIMGLPLAVYFAWVYQVGPGGIHRDKSDASLTGEGPQNVVPLAGDDRSGVETELPNDMSIAVLPFLNLSDNEENQYFSDGLAEELLTMLSRVPGLRVCSRTSSFTCRGEDLDIPSVARKLGVHHLLEGSVRRSGNMARITAQLIDGRNDSHLWASNFDRDLDDIFVVQGEIASEITRALQLALTPDQQRAVSDATTTQFDAYDHYLRGRVLYHRTEPDHLVKAKNAFEEAIRVDPEYALAYAGLTFCLADLHWFHRHAEAPVDAALAASEKAVQLADHLAESHAARGLAFWVAGEFDAAEREYERAIEINPQLFEPLHFYARMSLTRGQDEKAAEFFMRAAAARPEDYQSIGLAGQAFAGAGNDEKSISVYRDAMQRAERHLHLNPHDTRAILFLALAQIKVGDQDSGRELVERALSLEPDFVAVIYNAACCYCHLGNHEMALDLLERLPDLGWNQPAWLDSDADLDPLRKHPRFKALRKQFDS